MNTLAAFVVCALCLAGLDFVWLGLTTESLYRPAMGSLLRNDFQLAPGIGFYVIYAFALVVLVIRPAVANGQGRGELTLKAGLLGLAAFATYDLTGLAVIHNWPVRLSFIDMAWGTFAATVACNVTALILKALRQA